MASIRVEMSEELFKRLCLRLAGTEEPVLDELDVILQKKLDSMVNRDLYSRYKTAPSDLEREQARKAYLDRKGISKDFRW